MDYKTCTIEDLVEHISSVSRERVRQKLQLAKDRGDSATVEKIEIAKGIAKNLRHDAKSKLRNGVGVYTKADSIEYAKLFEMWCGMISRCCSKTSKASLGVYKNVTVSDDFKNFGNFKTWCLTQKGCGVDRFDIEKDLLSQGLGSYSAETCLFLPEEINGALVKRNDDNGLPVGVIAHQNGTFLAKHRNIHIGTFKTIADASAAYVAVKEQHIRNLAAKWQSQIEPKAYDALMAYKVPLELVQYSAVV